MPHGRSRCGGGPLIVVACFTVGTVLQAIERSLGITDGWRLVLNQIPIMMTMSRVDRWCRSVIEALPEPPR